MRKVMKPIEYRNANDGKNNIVSDENRLVCDPEKDRTVQSEEPNSNLNTIVARFGLNRLAPPPMDPRRYGDFRGVHDFQSAQNVLLNAREAFMKLPAKVRQELGNDPAQLLELVHSSDDKNYERAVALGLVPAKEPPAGPVKVEVVPPPVVPSDVKSGG